MAFLRRVCERPEAEKPVMILAVGYAKKDAEVPAHAGQKKALDEIFTVR